MFWNFICGASDGLSGLAVCLQLNSSIICLLLFSYICRYDYGISEEMGYRQSMEDSCTILQHMDVPALAVHDLAPQSFFGVFDGHGGPNASLYLSQMLHVNIGNALSAIAPELKDYIEDIREGTLNDSHPMKDHVDKIVIEALKSSFIKTDADFIGSSPHSQNGSTATTALVLGSRLYCANTGDSRTFICRNFKPVRMTEDHKPAREDEQKRIRDAGGFVINNRVMGELAVSRAFGDAEFKKGIQSIIDEEGVKMPSGKKKNSDSEEGKNWDQPLIIARPDVEVSVGG
jgi:serine/threonine protein phosphatase PrpC